MENDREYISWETIRYFIFHDLKGDPVISKKKMVLGLPRGGWPIAVMFSHAFDLKIIKNLSSDLDTTSVLIVDDIADTGSTLIPYSTYPYKFTIVTFAYHRQSKVVPYKWKYEKKDKWLVFPWEKNYNVI